MSKDLFNKYNLLWTDPTNEKLLYTGVAWTNVADLYPTRPALKWSQAMSQAALEYLNLKGTNWSPQASIFMTARNKYAYTICGPIEGTFKHTMNSAGPWNVVTALQTWFTSNSSFFANANLLNGNYTHGAVACSCDYTGEVECGFIFTYCLNGKDITDSAPVFLNYTPGASCAAVPLASLF